MILDSAHGGKNGSDISHITDEWIMIDNRLKTWHEAKEACRDIGGELYSNLTKAQQKPELLPNCIKLRKHSLKYSIRT